MKTMNKPYQVLIASYLEPEQVERVRQVDARLKVIYRPDLIGEPQYAADHYSTRSRSPTQEAEWRSLLAEADILFDFDYSHLQDLPELAQQVRWLQATSAGIGQMIRRLAYDRRMPHTIFTTTSGVHARPLAEFVLMAVMMHFKNFLTAVRNQERHTFERYAGSDLEGRTMALVGLGRIGAETARLAGAIGLRVVGCDLHRPALDVERFYPLSELHDMLRIAEILVLIVPHTPQTEGMIGRQELALLPEGAFLVNIARGAVVDEAALIAALHSGRLSGAALDVFAQEPLPAESPLWDMPNVLICPHSASTSDRENERITDLFCDNLRRWLAGEPLRNVLVPERYF
jgi:glyoxylate/hydroxypyruvate reductase